MAKGRKVYRSGKASRRRRRRSSHGAGRIILFIVFILCIIFAAYVITGVIFSFLPGSGGEETVSQTVSAVEETPSQTESIVEEEPVASAAYCAAAMPTATVLDSSQWQTFLDSAKAQGYTAVSVTLKDGQGQLYYQSAVSRAVTNKAVAAGAIDLNALCQTIRNAGLTPIAQMGCFVDRYGSIGTDATFTSGGSRLWQGTPNAANASTYLDPYTETARAYLTQIAQEIASAGFETILLNDVSFPTGSVFTDSVRAQHNTTDLSETAILSQFVSEVQSAVSTYGTQAVPVFPALSYLGANATDAAAYGGACAGISANTAVLVDFASLPGANAVAGYETLDAAGILTQLTNHLSESGTAPTLVVSSADYAAYAELLKSLTVAGIVVQ